jgi:hypothetical protein
MAVCAWPVAAFAQAAAAPAPAPAAPPDDPDLDINVSQPDFTIITLPTTLRLPKFKSAFRVTHRFTRSLSQGDFGSLVEDFFGLDNGAVIGLEYRFGLMKGLQVGINRTSNRTIDLFGEYNVLQQNESHPIGLNVYAGVDGTNNFRDAYSPSVGVIASRELGKHGAVYLEPIWVNNTNPLPEELTTEDNSTFMIAAGARIRIRPTVYLVAEIAPRTGYKPGVNHASFALEKRAGGHSFQLNFSNDFGTLMSQIARGGLTNDDWYMGFNISRKFF